MMLGIALSAPRLDESGIVFFGGIDNVAHPSKVIQLAPLLGDAVKCLADG